MLYSLKKKYWYFATLRLEFGIPVQDPIHLGINQLNLLIIILI